MNINVPIHHSELPTHTNSQLFIYTPVLPPNCVSAAAARAQMSVTNTVGFNQRGGVWIKPAIPERPVFTGEPEQEIS